MRLGPHMHDTYRLYRWSLPSHHRCGTGIRESNRGGRGWAFCVPHRQEEEEAKVKHSINDYLFKAKGCGRSPTSALKQKCRLSNLYEKALEVQQALARIGPAIPVGLHFYKYGWSSMVHWGQKPCLLPAVKKMGRYVHKNIKFRYELKYRRYNFVMRAVPVLSQTVHFES